MAHIPLLLENIFSPHIKTSRKCLFQCANKKRDKSSGCFWYGVWHGTPNVFLIHILHTYMRRCQSSINKNPPSPLLSLFILISWDFFRILCVNISKSNPCSEKVPVFFRHFHSFIKKPKLSSQGRVHFEVSLAMWRRKTLKQNRHQPRI